MFSTCSLRNVRYFCPKLSIVSQIANRRLHIDQAPSFNARFYAKSPIYFYNTVRTMATTQSQSFPNAAQIIEALEKDATLLQGVASGLRKQTRDSLVKMEPSVVHTELSSELAAVSREFEKMNRNNDGTISTRNELASWHSLRDVPIDPSLDKALGIAAVKKITESSSWETSSVYGGNMARTVEKAAIAKSLANEQAALIHPTRRQLVALGVCTAVPMIGFGFVDNLVMILAGDAIDRTLGLVCCSL